MSERSIIPKEYVTMRVRKCLSRTFWRGSPASKKPWLTSYSIQQRNGLLDCCCCWPISARKAGPSRLWRRSLRRPSPRWSAQPGMTFVKQGFIDYNGHLEVHSSLFERRYWLNSRAPSDRSDISVNDLATIRNFRGSYEHIVVIRMEPRDRHRR